MSDFIMFGETRVRIGDISDYGIRKETVKALKVYETEEKVTQRQVTTEKLEGQKILNQWKRLILIHKGKFMPLGKFSEEQIESISNHAKDSSMIPVQLYCISGECYAIQLTPKKDSSNATPTYVFRYLYGRNEINDKVVQSANSSKDDMLTSGIKMVFDMAASDDKMYKQGAGCTPALP